MSETELKAESSPDIHKLVDKPFWASTKAVCFLAVLVTLIGFVVFGAPKEVSETIAEAILFGLPILLGAQGAMDFAAVRRR